MCCICSANPFFFLCLAIYNRTQTASLMEECNMLSWTSTFPSRTVLSRSFVNYVYACQNRTNGRQEEEWEKTILPDEVFNFVSVFVVLHNKLQFKLFIEMRVRRSLPFFRNDKQWKAESSEPDEKKRKPQIQNRLKCIWTQIEIYDGNYSRRARFYEKRWPRLKGKIKKQTFR